MHHIKEENDYVSFSKLFREFVDSFPHNVLFLLPEVHIVVIGIYPVARICALLILSCLLPHLLHGEI